MKVIKTSYGDCILRKGLYPNKRLALSLVDTEDGSLVAKLTTNMPEVPLEEGEFIVKTWSENTQIAKECYNSGLFERTGYIRLRFCVAQVWEFKDKGTLDELT